MFLRHKTRRKDGKEHRYWSIVENRRVSGGRTVQRHVLYLGEINDTQRAAWCRTIEAFDEDGQQARQIALFPEDRQAPALNCDVVHVRLSELRLHRPRQWGACWLACHVWDQLRLDNFWSPRLLASREGTRWLDVLKTLVAYRLIDPGSEWRLHRQWYERSAMGDLLGADLGLVQKDNLYRCLDRLLVHKVDLFSFLQQRWKSLFGADFEVLLYDLTSTYFECDAPAAGKRRFGYSRDKRSDCVQVVIALIVTPAGLPLAYEVMAGNTSDKTTLRAFLDSIESQYGKARRVWLMDRGIPTEALLHEIRTSRQETFYLVGTSRAKVKQYEKQWLELPWHKVRESVEVKLFAQDGELYVLAKSEGRQAKENAMRRKKLARLLWKLRAMRRSCPKRDQLLMRVGAAKTDVGRAFGFVKIHLPSAGQEVTRETFTFRLDKGKLKEAELRDGHYLLRTNLVAEDPAVLWDRYVQLTQIEAAFKCLKSDLGIRPIHHQLEHRVDAHILVAFLAYCLTVTLRHRLRTHAPGLTPRAVLEKLAGIQMLDVSFPTTDGRRLIMPRYTEPSPEQALLLHHLNLCLPQQPPPRITTSASSAPLPPLKM